MIKNPKLVERAILEYERAHPLTLEQKYALLNGMYEEARLFGHFTPETVLEGIEVDIALAKILNTHVPSNPHTNR